MDHRHLWLRSRKQMAIMQIRNAIIYASYEFFDRNGFIKFDSPILSGNAAEIPQSFLKQIILELLPF